MGYLYQKGFMPDPHSGVEDTMGTQPVPMEVKVPPANDPNADKSHFMDNEWNAMKSGGAKTAVDYGKSQLEAKGASLAAQGIKKGIAAIAGLF